LFNVQRAKGLLYSGTTSMPKLQQALPAHAHTGHGEFADRPRNLRVNAGSRAGAYASLHSIHLSDYEQQPDPCLIVERSRPRPCISESFPASRSPCCRSLTQTPLQQECNKLDRPGRNGKRLLAGSFDELHPPAQ